MEIIFRLNDNYVPTGDDFARWANEEGVGREADTNSQIYWEENKFALKWQTCISGFKYFFNKKEFWVYQGAERGFLDQELLPPPLKAAGEEDVRIVRASGTYGHFEGPGALEEYRNKKRAWVGAVGPTYDAFETFGFFQHNGWEMSSFCASVYTLAQTEEKPVDLGLEAEVDRLSELSSLRVCLGRLNERLPSGRLSMGQFATLVARLQAAPQRGAMRPRARPVDLLA